MKKNKKKRRNRKGRTGRKMQKLEIGPTISINIVKINGVQKLDQQFPIFITYIYNKNSKVKR